MEHQYDRRDIFLTLAEASSLFPLLSLTPKKMSVASAVQEMGLDGKEIETGPPGLFKTSKLASKLGPRDAFWGPCLFDLLACIQLLGIGQDGISGPISYPGSCNFRKQCIVLCARPPPHPPIDLDQGALTISTKPLTENCKGNNVTICILKIRHIVCLTLASPIISTENFHQKLQGKQSDYNNLHFQNSRIVDLTLGLPNNSQ